MSHGQWMNVFCLVLLTCSGARADKTWNGSASTDFEAAANWTGGAPADDLLTDVAIITYGTANKPVLTRDRSIKGLNPTGGYWSGENLILFSGAPAYTLRLGATGIMMTAAVDGANRNVDMGTNANIELTVSQTWEAKRSTLFVRGVLSGDESCRLTKTGAGTLVLTGNNTYAGGTDIAGGTLQVNHSQALGSGPLTVGSGGMLSINCSLFTNSVPFADGSTLKSPEWGTAYPIVMTNGVLSITGAVSVVMGSQNPGNNIYIDDVIEGSGGLNFTGVYNNSDYYVHTVHLRRANTFTGPVTVGTSGKVNVTHPDGLGAGTNDVKVSATTSTAKLWIYTDTRGMSTNHSFTVATNGVLYQAVKNTTMSNTVTLAGGAYVFPVGGSSYNNGAIILAAGTTNRFRSGAWDGGDWYQTGTMTGSGALVFDTETSGSGNRHLNGNNAGYSGTIYNPLVSRAYVGSDNGLGTGTYVLQGASSADNLLQLDNSVTLANAFQGTGKVSTVAYTLTHTGTLVPGTTNAIGTLAFTSSGAGKLDFRGTYNWNYNEITNDLVTATALTFGNAGGQAAVNVSWIGTGSVPKPSSGGDKYALFSYTGADPSAIVTPWTVTAPAGMTGTVSVDPGTKRVILTLKGPSGGTIILLR